MTGKPIRQIKLNPAFYSLIFLSMMYRQLCLVPVFVSVTAQSCMSELWLAQ